MMDILQTLRALPIWAYAAAALTPCLALALVLWLRARRRARRNAAPEETRAPETPETPPHTEAPKRPRWEIANMQLLGARDDQQDAFGLSRLDEAAEGFLAVVADGMGGKEAGQAIAQRAVETVLAAWQTPPDAEGWRAMPGILRALNAAIYDEYRERGGTTLLVAAVESAETGGYLSFASVGDSFLFLLREGQLYECTLRHAFVNARLLDVFFGGIPLEEAFTDPQSHALYSYIGMEEVRIDATRRPLPLRADDALLLCSDGVGEVLSREQIAQAMAQPPAACCAALEEMIRQMELPEQDNATAIAFRQTA